MSDRVSPSLKALGLGREGTIMIQHQLEAAGAVQGDLHNCPDLPYIDITQSRVESRTLEIIHEQYGILVGALNLILIS